jgi:ABC-2 type transport system permease protein
MMKQFVLVLAVLVIFGVLLPWYKGFDFLDPVMIVAYCSLGLLFVAPASAEAFGPAQPLTNSSDAVRRMGAVLAYGWGVSVLILFTGIATVNVTHWHGSILSPPAALLTASLLFSFTACVTVIGLCAILSRKLSPASVKGMIRAVFLVVLVAIAFGRRFLGTEAQSSIDARMTTEGITQFAFIASAIMACTGAGLVAAAALSAQPKGVERS